MHTNLRRILCLSGLVLSAALLVGMPPAYAAETGDEFEGERVVWIPVEGVIATRDGENPWSGNRGLAGLCDGEGPCGYLVQNQAGPGQTGVDARVELVPGTGGYTFEGVVPAVRYFDANAGWGEATVPYELEISVKVTLTGDTYRVEGEETNPRIMHPDSSAERTRYAVRAIRTFEGTAVGAGAASGQDPGPAPGQVSGQGLKQWQRQALAAVERGDVSRPVASVPPPAAAFTGGGRQLVNGILAVVAVLLLVFPAELFNSTYDKHHDKVEALLARLLPWRRKPRPAADLVLAERDTVAAAMESGQEVAAEPAEPAVVPDQPVLAASAGFASSGNAKYAACAVAGAVIGGFLDPGFGFSWASFTLVAGVLVTIVVGTVIGSMPGVLLRRRLGLPATAVLEAVPTGLVVAVVCVVVSRLVGFQPGYLYGLVGGLAFVVALTKLQQARAVFAGTLVALGVALAAWLAYVPLTSAATQPDPGFAVTISQAVAAALFVGGIEGTLIGLTPLKLLPGYTIWSWSRPAWFGLAIVTAFLFVTVLLRPENGYLGSSSTASVWVTYGLFAGFGMLSAAFWWWFEHGPGSEPDDPRA